MNEEEILTPNEEVSEPKTYTEEEVQKILQSESDKRVNSAIQKKEKEFQAKMKAEAERIAKEASMSEEEKFQTQLKAEREAFEAERAEFMRLKLEGIAIKELTSMGLPADFAPYLQAENEDGIKENIAAFKGLWDTQLQKMVDERLAGRTPKVKGTDTQDTALSKESFFKLPFKEREALMAEDSDLLKKLQ